MIYSDFKELSIKHTHINLLDKINWQHKDPFDKIIISQAKAENIYLLSYDKIFSEYQLNLL